jgi:tetratricopeptide (TPR) repeat protein
VAENRDQARRRPIADPSRREIMNKPLALVVILVMCALQLLLTGPEAVAQSAQSGAGRYGTVHFSISCRPGAQEQFERAVAMLHSFFYPENVKAFEAILAADPDCAMAYWGLAISQRPNPLVPPWAPESLKRGLEAVQKGKAVAKTERERDWLAALEQAYAGYDSVPTTARSERYEAAMERLAAKYADDKEAAIFYALALLEAVDHRDKTYGRQIKAGAILEAIDRVQPDHPGLAHYIIHAYDFEPLAPRGVLAADKYAQVAPSAPHAQHMPSHIYSILGRWDDSIRSNQAAVKASRDYAARNAPGTTFSQEPHAQDFMAYAYLQLGQNREASRVVDELGTITKFSGARNYGRDTGQVAPAARYVLERAAWSEALVLPVRTDAYAYAQAIPRFTRAVGAARLGKADVAKEEIAALQALSKAAENSYWSEQVQVLVLAATGFQARAEGRNDEAVKLLRAAADLEDSTEKHVAMENRLYPMREMLGDLLLETGQPALALQAYEASLHAAPNRLRGFYGVARAAKASGDPAKARDYFEKLAVLGRNADPDRVEVLEARAFLGARP